MSFFANSFREEVSKFKDPAMYSESTFPIGYPTTFLPLDYANGCKIYNKVIGSDLTLVNYSLGLQEGSVVTFIGPPGGGKTTLAIESALSIIAPFKDSVIIHDDVEGGSHKPRYSSLGKVSMKYIEEHVIHRNVGISSENFTNRVLLHCENKIQSSLIAPDQTMYFTGVYDSYGKPIMKLIPTVYILDSLPQLISEDLSKDQELGGQMAATSQARKNAQMFRQLTPKLKQANVILFVINHIKQKVEINSYIKTAAQINYLAQDETVPGGRDSLYLSNNIFKIKPSTKLKAEDGIGINGFLSKITLVKSRTNRAGQEVELIYDQNNGYDRLYTIYNLLKNNKLVCGGGKSFYIEGMKDVKFSQKEFKQAFGNCLDLRKHIKMLTIDTLEQMVPDFDPEFKDVVDKRTIDMLMSDMVGTSSII